MIKRFNKNEGFTLIELMIVVAIIGILAAIAVPNFLTMQLRAKRSEVPTNLSAVRTTELAYFHEFDTYTAATANPSSVPGTGQVAFPASDAWSKLGWSPDGKVRGQYGVAVTGTTGFTATGVCNVDGDSSNATFQGHEGAKPAMLTANDVF